MKKAVSIGICAVLVLGAAVTGVFIKHRGCDVTALIRQSASEGHTLPAAAPVDAADPYREGRLYWEIEKAQAAQPAYTLLQGETIRIDSTEVLTIAGQYRQEGKNEPYETALRYVLEREVLYAAAVDAGYRVSETDAARHVAAMRRSFAEASDRDRFLAYLETVGLSEDAYWERQLPVIQKEDTTAAYIAAIKAEKGLDIATSPEDAARKEDRWQALRARIIRRQLRRERVRVVPRQAGSSGE